MASQKDKDLFKRRVLHYIFEILAERNLITQEEKRQMQNKKECKERRHV